MAVEDLATIDALVTVKDLMIVEHPLTDDLVTVEGLLTVEDLVT